MSIKINISLVPFGTLNIKSPKPTEEKEEPQKTSNPKIVYESPHDTSSGAFEVDYRTNGRLYRVPTNTG